MKKFKKSLIAEWSKYFSSWMLILVFLTNISCRSRLKSTTLPKAFEDLHVELVNFLSEDIQLSNIKIILFDCSWQSELIEGKIESASVAIFKINGVGANGGKCSLKITTPAESSNTLKFLSEPGKLYETNRVVLERNAAQKLVATAILSRSYNRASNGNLGDSLGTQKPSELLVFESTLTGVTKLPDGDSIKAGSEYLGQLQCNPALHFVSIGEKKNADTLTFKFKFSFASGTKWKYDCSKLVIFQDSQFSYFADLNTPALAVVQGTAGDSVNLFNAATIDLKSVNKNTNASSLSDVFLKIQIGDCTLKEKSDPKNKNCYEEPKKD